MQRYVLDRSAPLDTVEVPLDDALGMVLAEAVVAPENVPPFANSAMDGYAVIAADTVSAPVELDVVGLIAAGQAPSNPVQRGQAIQIMTGAPMPEGADGIAIVERTEMLGTSTGDVGKVRKVRVLDPVEPGVHVRPAGSDIAAGDVVAERGDELSPAHIGVVASTGAGTVRVYRRPVVGVMTTGDELVEPGTGTLGPGQIRDSNRHVLLATLRQDGFGAVDLGIVGDTEEAVTEGLRRGAAECDAVLTTGGVSMGEFDFVKVVLSKLAAAQGAEAESRQFSVAIRPAKPLSVAFLQAESGRRLAIFGLPGNPVSSAVSYLVVARPALRVMAGHRPELPRLIRAVARERLGRRPGDGKLHLSRVRVESEADGRLSARLSGGQMSHQLGGMVGANGLGFLADGPGVEEGEVLDVLLFGKLDGAAAHGS